MKKKIQEIKRNIDNIDSSEIHHILLEEEDLSQKDINFFCEKLASRHEGYYLYWTAKKCNNANIGILQSGLVGCKDVDFIKTFIEDIAEFSYPKLYQDLLDSKNAHAVVLYAANIEGIDIQKLEDILIEINDTEVMTTFIEKVPNANFDRIQEVILNSDDLSTLVYLGEVFNDRADIKRIEDKIVESKSAGDIVDAAIFVKGIDKDRLLDELLKLPAPDFWVLFASGVEDADIKKIEDRLVELKHLPSLVKFAARIEGANVERIEDIIIKSKSLAIMGSFLLKCKVVNRERLIYEIVNSRNYKYIEKLAIQVEDKDYKILMNNYKIIATRSYVRHLKKKIKGQREYYKKNLKAIVEFQSQINDILNK